MQSEITFVRYDIALREDKHDQLDCETASTVSFDKPHLLFNKQAPPIEPIIINKRKFSWPWDVVTCCLLANKHPGRFIYFLTWTHTFFLFVRRPSQIGSVNSKGWLVDGAKATHVLFLWLLISWVYDSDVRIRTARISLTHGAIKHGEEKVGAALDLFISLMENYCIAWDRNKINKTTEMGIHVHIYTPMY